ncbi:unnamed protein product [Durusdinium trenchii]|uniref:Dynein intermediate chain n=1 Tax=Durusdinium trenchii TaxID=1381693 RepID=A0ABP0S8H9_9DINO
MEAEIEALRREREDKIRQIAEKRKQVEELRKKRSERASLKTSQGALTSNVDGLVAEILGGAGGATSSRASPEAPLKELSEKSRASPLGAERSLHFQQEVSVAAVDIEPDGHVSYERSCQTDMKGSDVGSGGEKSAAAAGSVSKSSANVLLRVADRAKNRVLTGTTASEERRLKRAAGQEAKADAERPEIKELSEEERKKLEGHPDYKAFFERATLLVERTLGQEAWDVALDFKNTSADAQTEGGGADALKHVDDYVEEKWAKGRCVTDLRFSPHRQEIFMAAYHQKANPELSDPDGCMLVWCATEFADEQQAVLTAFSSAFSDVQLCGTGLASRCDSPDVLQFVGPRGPVLKTPLSGKGHAHPVSAMEQVGTQNATNLVTASNDGRLCVWSLAMLNVPQETFDLKNESKAGRREPSVMSFSFPENETNILYVGSEDGAMWQVNLRGSKPGIAELYEGHDGPVTGVHMHPHQGSDSGISSDTTTDLCLTSSFDWSIKLWRVKQFQSPVLTLDTFEDYVYDARWHPTHPAVFASTDGEGRDAQAAKKFGAAHNSFPHTQSVLALNKCYWSMDGRKLATGDSEAFQLVF